MALEFPEGFPFNRPHPAVKSEQVSAAPQAETPVAETPVAETPVAEVPQAEPPRSKADHDFEAAIADDLELPKQPLVRRPHRVAGTTAFMRLAGADEALAAVRPIRERRRSPRQTLVAKATVRSDVQATVVASGFVSNISMAGVGFHTRRPLQIGEKYHLRIEVGPMKWASRLRVVTCKPVGDTWDVGAEFVGNDLTQLARREIAA
jgi:hypothetical protein